MGGKSSKTTPPKASTSPYNYSQPQPYYTPQHHQHPFSPSPHFNSAPPTPTPSNNTRVSKRLELKYSKIDDNYRTLDEVTAALARAGLESSNLIVGIDFTKSNEWTGAMSFNRRSLHQIADFPNPYEEAISIIGKTLSAFDNNNLIPCFGFGDASTQDRDVFSFYDDNRYCMGFEEVLSRYRELAPQLRLAGPTSFAPIIEMAMTIVEQSGGQYHVLLIIADGQVTRSDETEPGHLSRQEKCTIEAMVRASAYPLSIVLVGVGDGPWDMMMKFDDNIPSRAFDNFQFVNFTKIMSRKVSITRKQAKFALSALMEIPSQYKATLEHGLLGLRTGCCPERVPLPPPRSSNPYAYSSSSKTSIPNYSARNKWFSTPEFTGTNAPSTSTSDNQLCPVCFTRRKDMAFGCGHQTCCNCGEFLDVCPICRSPIQTKIRLY